MDDFCQPFYPLSYFKMHKVIVFVLKRGAFQTLQQTVQTPEKNALSSAHASLFKDTFDYKCKMIAPQFEPIMACMIEAIRGPTPAPGAFSFLSQRFT